MRPFEFEDLKQIMVACGIDSISELEENVDQLSFDDLGFDSVALMEMASRIEREFHVQVEEEELTGETMVADLLSVVSSRVSEVA